MNMKAIQVTVDRRLLAALDADEEVRRDGRSAVVRRALDQYLRRGRAKRIAEQYRHGYGTFPPTEFEGWEEEQSWPED